MSFFKKLTKEFEELKANLSDDKKDAHKDDGNMASDQGPRGYPPLGSQQPPYQAYQGSYPPQQPSPYGSYNQGYGSQPPPPQQYGAPQYGYAPPPPAPPGYANISAPAGWLAQFDPSSQRWFYIEKATGRTQWEAPPPQSNYDASRGYGVPDPQGQATGYYSGASDHDGGYEQHQYGGGNYPYDNGESEKKKSDKSGMLLAAAGGLAVGAVGGALVANALDDDDEHHAAAGAPVVSAPAQYGGAPEADPSMPPPVLGATDEDGHYVSGSDRESVQEARAEYEEALAEAADSDASHSEREELEEARQEYIEEYEENYGGDDD